MGIIIAICVFMYGLIYFLMPTLGLAQLISYCIWRWFRLSKTKLFLLSTLIGVGINSSMLVSAYLDYKKALISIEKTAIPGVANQTAGLAIASHYILILLLIITLIIGIPMNIILSKSILKNSKRF